MSDERVEIINYDTLPYDDMANLDWINRQNPKGWAKALKAWDESGVMYGYCGRGYGVYNSVYVTIMRLKKAGRVSQECEVTTKQGRVVVRKDNGIARAEERREALRNLLLSFVDSGDKTWTLDSILDRPFTEQDKETLTYYRTRVYQYRTVGITFDANEGTMTLRKKVNNYDKRREQSTVEQAQG